MDVLTASRQPIHLASMGVCANTYPLGRDVATAEALLRDIVLELVRLPLEERARQLHLTALALKQTVSGWSRQPPPDASREAMHDALEALRREVLDLRGATSEVRLRPMHGGTIRAIKSRR